MPIEFSFSWLLYDPIYAVALGLFVVLLIALIAYFVPWKWTPSQVNRYTRVLAMAAEVLVSVGIVGLITFAARSKIDAEINAADTKSQELQRQVNAAVWEFARVHCLSAPSQVAPTRTLGTIYETCQWWPKVIRGPGEFIDWWGARKQFEAMAVEPTVPAVLRSQYAGIAQQIAQLIKVQNDHALDKHKKGLLERQFSWAFVAMCACFAIVGVALKWARAAIDLRVSRPRA